MSITVDLNATPVARPGGRWAAFRAALAACLAGTALAAPLPAGQLAAGGRSDYVILTGRDPGETERLAAEELQRYLEVMTGATLPIVAEASGRPWIAVGDTAESRAIEVPSRYGEDDSFRIRTVGTDLVLKGASPRASLYAVYAFLERQGCWWFAPAAGELANHAELVPYHSTLRLEPTDVLEQPAMRYRTQDAGAAASMAGNWPALFEWMGKARMNTLAIDIGEYERDRDRILPELRRRGIRLAVGQHGVMPMFLPASRYLASHPEWFGEVNGVRTAGKPPHLVVFETASADAVATFIDNIAAYLRSRPEIDVFQLWPPDNEVWSDSPESRALGAPPERMARLVQQVTDGVRRAGLGTRVSLIAYSAYTDPPRTMSFDASNLVQFCPIGQDFAYALDDPSNAVNAGLAARLKRWTAEFPGEVTLYTYYAKYSWGSLPVSFPAEIARDIAFYRRLGCRGASVYSEPGNWLTLEANHLAFARALWQGDLDGERWYAEYLKARFGGASAAMHRYFTLATQISLRALIPQSSTDAPELDERLVPAARQAINEALERADTSEAIWAVSHLAWQPDYLAEALTVRALALRKAPAGEIDLARKALAQFLAGHWHDGTFLDAPAVF